MTSPSPGTGEGGARSAQPSGRVRAVPSNDQRLRARELRDRARAMRAKPTDAERRLWSMLRDTRLSGHKFRRQHVIGSSIVDFVCLDCQLIIEADGSQHADNAQDRKRDAYLISIGYEVLRFWNSDVLGNPGGVFDAISAALSHPSPFRRFAAPSLSPVGRGLGDTHG